MLYDLSFQILNFYATYLLLSVLANVEGRVRFVVVV